MLLLPGANDVNRLVGKVKRVADVRPFSGRPLQPAFMVEYTNMKTEPKVRYLYAAITTIVERVPRLKLTSS